MKYLNRRLATELKAPFPQSPDTLPGRSGKKALRWWRLSSVWFYFFSCQLWKPVLNLHLYQYILSYRRRESIIERGYISMTIFRYMQIILPAFPYQNHFQQALNTVESRLNANSKISLQLYICISLVSLWAAQWVTGPLYASVCMIGIRQHRDLTSIFLTKYLGMFWGLSSESVRSTAHKRPPVANNMTLEHLENSKQMSAVPIYIKKLLFLKPSCC